MAEKEGFGTLRCECRLSGIQQVSTGHLPRKSQIVPYPGGGEGGIWYTKV